ncbi:MAG: hypothetical protein HQL87_07615 [Magnetococcales bacterium]|nr:hypothetical protein [Magnetococcales bacterium]
MATLLYFSNLFRLGRRPVGFVLLGGVLVVLSGCSTVPKLEGGGSQPPMSKIDINNACSIFQGRNSWYQVMNDSFRQWGTPVHVQLAIIHQESKFRSDARPISKGFMGVLPGQRLSSALGYAQALDGTWAEYKRQTGNKRADREDFRDAVDFIGWYNHVSYKKLHISKWDARNLYLAYHEGHGGYAACSYRKKSWLMRVAEKVERNAARYDAQLAQCKDSLTTNREEKENNWFVWPF